MGEWGEPAKAKRISPGPSVGVGSEELLDTEVPGKMESKGEHNEGGLLLRPELSLGR